MNSRILKLGTRRSLLAWAQSTWVAREIERLNEDIKVELVGIETRGDQIQDVPLSAVSGKEFFVAEIDAALRSGEVDLTVHSMKDLSLDRPEEFALGAIPKRENPRDIILWGPQVGEKLRAGKTLRVGTSSPRRLENIPGFVARALPKFGSNEPQVEFVEIRGNVNSRLARVHLSETDTKQLDGVVLAFAGVIRLWRDEKARVEMTELLKGVRWMVLPLKSCPAAPAQGALAIEVRRADTDCFLAVAKLHDDKTSTQVARERDLLREWGGGCHQRFGATAVDVSELGPLMFVRGALPDGKFVEETRWLVPSHKQFHQFHAPIHASGAPIEQQSWDGLNIRSTEKNKIQTKFTPEIGSSAIFIAHWRAVHDPKVLSPDARLWVSGESSWFKLAELGLWVEGCAEGFGFDSLSKTLSEDVLRLPALSDWTVLTHEGGASSWSGPRVLATYEVAQEVSPELIANLKKATHLFWASGSQFEKLSQYANPEAHHSCGPGKTSAVLRSSGCKKFDVFPSVEEWRKWIRK